MKILFFITASLTPLFVLGTLEVNKGLFENSNAYYGDDAAPSLLYVTQNTSKGDHQDDIADSPRIVVSMILCYYTSFLLPLFFTISNCL